MSTTELEAKCRELRQLQRLIDEAQAEVEAIRDSIKAHMGDTEEIRAGEYKITWRPMTTTRIDGRAFQQAFPDVAQAFVKTTTVRRFCIA